MNKLPFNIWGRIFELEVVYDYYEGEEILPVQLESLRRFLATPNLINNAKVAVENYCLNRNSEDIGSYSIDNIFKYIIPESIYIQRPYDENRVVGIMCNYKYDVDNGLAIVFKNEKFDMVGSQNII